MFDPTNLIRPHLKQLRAYEPILPIEVLSEQLDRSPESIVKLDGNENPYGPVPEVLQALGDLRSVHIYPDPTSTRLRQALAEFAGVPIENLLVGAGADELIDLLMRLLLDPGEKILTCPPTFGMYAFDAAVNAAGVVEVPRQKDFSLDLDEIARAVDKDSPKLLYLASPNNPDGSLLSDAEYGRLLDLPLIVVLDEAYVEFAPPGSSRISEVAVRPNLVVLRTFSKWAGLAGLRVGYGAFPSSLMPDLWKIKQPYNLSVAGSRAAEISLASTPTLDVRAEKLLSEREKMNAGLDGISYLEPYPSQSNFILCRVVGREAGELKAALTRRGILVRHFDTPQLNDHIRISVGKPEHTQSLLTALTDLE